MVHEWGHAVTMQMWHVYRPLLRQFVTDVFGEHVTTRVIEKSPGVFPDWERDVDLSWAGDDHWAQMFENSDAAKLVAAEEVSGYAANTWLEFLAELYVAATEHRTGTALGKQFSDVLAECRVSEYRDSNHRLALAAEFEW